MSQPPRIRVVTYNVRDLRGDVKAIARVMQALQPDVACLQQVPRHPFSGHRIGVLADECGLLWSGGGMPSGGTAILTSLRVDQRAAHAARLPVSGAFTRSRGYAAAVVAVPGQPAFTVASLHLSLDRQERVRHVQAVLERVRRFGPAPYVFAGDLNEPPGGPSWQLLAGAGVDAVAASGAGQQPTYPASAPDRRIDAVFASAGFVVRCARVIDGGLDGLDGMDDIDGIDAADLRAASDHLPVVADLELSATAASKVPTPVDGSAG
jgi:endonuclease/exonuclease/phosphatase family metal-dependent hydrolase